MKHPNGSCFICCCCGCLVPSGDWDFCLMMKLFCAWGGSTHGIRQCQLRGRTRVFESSWPDTCAHCSVSASGGSCRNVCVSCLVSLVSRLSECQFLVPSVCPALGLSLALYVGHATSCLCVSFSYYGSVFHCRRRLNSAATLTNAHIN